MAKESKNVFNMNEFKKSGKKRTPLQKAKNHKKNVTTKDSPLKTKIFGFIQIVLFLALFAYFVKQCK